VKTSWERAASKSSVATRLSPFLMLEQLKMSLTPCSSNAPACDLMHRALDLGDGAHTQQRNMKV
jgi:hypothetical protein